jgi:ATP-dependent exoDNAse (exonuclease V) alpha subunit
MAIYHLSATIVSRGRGHSVVAAAAYRAGAALRDERYGITHSHASRAAADHSEILAPRGAPPWVSDRGTLWNRVEAAERRRDAQLARAVEAGLPVELSAPECVGLVRDYVLREFIAEGMIADVNIRRDNPANPVVHILLSLRDLLADGFGAKRRGWNGKARLLAWRSAWAATANEHLARAGHDVRIDHRTLEAQDIDLEPVRRIGFGRPLSERVAERRRIAEENGVAILEDPGVLLRALTRQRATFNMEQLAQFLRSRTGPGQFDAALTAVIRCAELVALKPDGTHARFTSKDMIDTAKSLKQRMTTMAIRTGHGVRGDPQQSGTMRPSLDAEVQRAFDYLVADGDLKAIAIPKSAKLPLLDAAREVWKASGWHVLDSPQPPDALSRDCVLVVEGPEMLGLKELERLSAIADKARAKLVLVADSPRFEAMRSESAFHSVLRDIGFPGATAGGPRVF